MTPPQSPRLPSPRLIHRRNAERQLSTRAQFQLFISLPQSDHPSIRPISAATNGGVQLLPELITSVRSSLRVVGIHGTKVQLHRLRKNGDVLRIMPGIYLPAGILADTSSTERQQITFIARLAALSIRYPTYVLSGPSAAFLLGLPTECRLKDLFVYSSSPSGTRRIVFPHVVTVVSRIVV